MTLALDKVSEFKESGRWSKNVDGPDTYERIFKIVIDSGWPPENISEDEIAALRAIPRKNEEHPRIDNAYCDSISGQIEEDWWHWTVVASYSIRSWSTDSQERETTEDPTSAPAEIDYDGTPYQVPFVKAYDDADAFGEPSIPVLNSAKDQHDPPAMRIDTLDVITIDKNYKPSELALDELRFYRGSINSVEMSIAGQLVKEIHGWMRKLKVRRRFDTEGNMFFAAHFEIEVGRIPRLTELADIGFYYIDASDRVRVTESMINSSITPGSDADEPVDEPAKLDGSGGLQTDQNADPVYSPFRDKWKANWKLLALPETADAPR